MGPVLHLIIIIQQAAAAATMRWNEETDILLFLGVHGDISLKVIRRAWSL